MLSPPIWSFVATSATKGGSFIGKKLRKLGELQQQDLFTLPPVSTRQAPNGGHLSRQVDFASRIRSCSGSCERQINRGETGLGHLVSGRVSRIGIC